MSRFNFLFVILLFSLKLNAQNLELSNDNYQIFYNQSNKQLKLVNKEFLLDTVTFTTSLQILINSNNVTLRETKISEDINFDIVNFNGNHNLYTAGNSRIRSVQQVSKLDNKLLFEYTENNEFSITAVLEMPLDNSYPSFSYTLNAKINSNFSVGFIGAPTVSHTQLDELWQPIIWTEKKFPQNSYLSLSYRCTLPAVMATNRGITYGLIVDPSSFPFDPLPTYRRSSFGVSIRNNESMAQPAIWAPVLGTDFSKFSSGQSFTFKIRLYCGKKPITDYVSELASGLYKFNDYERNNQIGSLNKTLDNMINYGLSEFSMFNEALKAPSYETDIPGSVKASSGISAINLAYLTDDSVIFKKRALPVMEFLLSRSNLTYANEESQGAGQIAYNKLGDPVMRLSEMVALYNISGKKMPFLLNLAKDKQVNLADPNHEQMWKQYVALFKATGEQQYKNLAISVADNYINNRINRLETGFDFQHHYSSSFWQQLAPKFIDLLEMYDLTGDRKYLDASRVAAKRYSLYTWMSPAVPDSSIIVNKNNLAPLYRRNTGAPRISIPEESVPAWRLSTFGLNSEAAGTSNGHKAIFMANHAPFFLRIGSLTNDDFLKKIAKSAIIGRYTNFPGYHINTDYTTVFEKVNFPNMSTSQLNTTTSMHYNHVWPMMTMIVDYLVNDAVSKANGKITFPSEYMEGDAFIQSKVWGSKPGKFYTIDSATLWMPKQLVNVGNQQLNYISARKNDTLMVAFTNQLNSSVSSTITIDTNLARIKTGALLTIIRDNGNSVQSVLNGNQFTINVSANGITAIIIHGANIEPKLQDKFKNSQENYWKKDFVTTPFAATKAMIINYGNELSSVFIYSAADKGLYSSFILKYTLNGIDTISVTDSSYPFEFSIPLSKLDENFIFTVEAVNSNGIVEKSPRLSLNKINVITAEIHSDEKFIKLGESIRIPIKLKGTAPWSLSYTDGTNITSVNNITNNPYNLILQPSQHTILELKSVADNIDLGDVYGKIKINRMNNSLLPVFDGMVRENQNDGSFSTTQIDIKNDSPFSREGIFTFNISSLTNQDITRSAFRFYLSSSDKILNDYLKLDVIDRELNNSLTWSNKPADNEFTKIQGNQYLSNDDIGSYIDWEITNYLKKAILEGKTMLSFRISLSLGTSALIRGFSTESSNFKPEILFSNDQTLPIHATDFTVIREDDRAKIKWKVKDDAPRSYYELLHMVNNTVFVPLQTFSKPNNNEDWITYYSKLQQGTNYYKLITFSANGIKQTEFIKALNYSLEGLTNATLYPNPSVNRTVNLALDNFVGDKIKVNILSNSGIILSKKTLLLHSNNNLQIDFNNMAAGVYYVEIYEGAFYKVLKMVLN